MATITVKRNLSGIDLTSSDDFNEVRFMDIVSRSSTRLSMGDSDSRINFYGTGLTYQMSGGEIVGITAGRVTSVTFTSASGATVFLNWTGLDLSAPTFFTYVMTQNWTALNAFLFGTGDTYNLTDGRDVARGGAGGDVMHGFGGNDVLYGDTGNDRLYGENGADKLYGSSGADTLIGGAGIDTLSGGSQADTFVFTVNGATNRDILSDFNAVDDRLQFENAVFTGLGATTGALAASRFVAGTAAADSGDRFIYQKSTGSLWYDADGSGAGAKVLVAELVDGTTLTAADIFII